jgi:hypothetical protein
MSVRTALVGAATTVVLVAGLGSPPLQDAAREADASVLLRTVTVIPSWDIADAPGDVIGGVAVRLSTLIVLAALLCGLAGRRGARGPALLAGWGALLVAAAAANAAAFVYTAAVVLDGEVPGSYWDNLVGAANTGAAFALWTGWLVGLTVALATPSYRPSAQTEGWTPVATPPRISDPPPPWWAPTTSTGPGGETLVRPGPSVFEPQDPPPRPHMRPVVAGIDDPDTHLMTTVSGDPHPSDPDATQAVGMPHADAPTEAMPATAGATAATAENQAAAQAPGPAATGSAAAESPRAESPAETATPASGPAADRSEAASADAGADATAVLPPAGAESDVSSVLPADDASDATDVMPRAPD